MMILALCLIELAATTSCHLIRVPNSLNPWITDQSSSSPDRQDKQPSSSNHATLSDATDTLMERSLSALSHIDTASFRVPGTDLTAKFSTVQGGTRFRSSDARNVLAMKIAELKRLPSSFVVDPAMQRNSHGTARLTLSRGRSMDDYPNFYNGDCRKTLDLLCTAAIGILETLEFSVLLKWRNGQQVGAIAMSRPRSSNSSESVLESSVEKKTTMLANRRSFVPVPDDYTFKVPKTQLRVTLYPHEAYQPLVASIVRALLKSMQAEISLKPGQEIIREELREEIKEGTDIISLALEPLLGTGFGYDLTFSDASLVLEALMTYLSEQEIYETMQYSVYAVTDFVAWGSLRSTKRAGTIGMFNLTSAIFPNVTILK
ncbi:uncharacterized protein KY384_002135 [Bacidia gigantensis]|uniref:uncharacterized protein n=1 Tax=Bacidia gigantensis TaxID=2732470 RepID=UPI001D04EE5A|nr:uncharacterized protein KY384_002135 [Bacidia gigantensis]KAG8533352.1 hypothetical protein KY384_002135 [Bacidia gigantensis]